MAVRGLCSFTFDDLQLEQGEVTHYGLGPADDEIDLDVDLISDDADTDERPTLPSLQPAAMQGHTLLPGQPVDSTGELAALEI